MTKFNLDTGEPITEGPELSEEQHALRQAISHLERLHGKLGRKKRNNAEHDYLFKESAQIIKTLKALWVDLS